MLMLHELAHAYHHQILGFEYPRIKQLFDAAEASGTYDAVTRWDGKTERAYAMSNPKEYFAESSEAYFGRNDFYPFNRKQLRLHDPKMYELVGQLWNDPISEVKKLP